MNGNKWDNEEWLNDAKVILSWRMLPKSNPVMLVTRHSHREDSTNVGEVLKLRLTEKGKKAAFYFGERLPRKKRIEIYYSSHPRCIETAQHIAEGYNSVSSGAQLISDIRVLLGPKGSGERIGNEMMSLGGPEFVRRWIEDKLPEETIEPIREFETTFRSEVLGRLNAAEPYTLQVYVTHDLVIMGSRCVLFGTIPSYENWTPFLGGFGVTVHGEQLIGYERGNELAINS